MSELEKYKKAVEYARLGFALIYGADCNPIKEIDVILNPPQEFEDVEVVRWECKECASTYNEEGIVVSKSVDWKGCGCSEDGSRRFRLTGTITRPVPQKVERSVSKEVWLDKDGAPWDKPVEDWGGRVDIFPEAASKQGTLTFTWTE